jgi:hypothetical protein
VLLGKGLELVEIGLDLMHRHSRGLKLWGPIYTVILRVQRTRIVKDSPMEAKLG